MGESRYFQLVTVHASLLSHITLTPRPLLFLRIRDVVLSLRPRDQGLRLRRWFTDMPNPATLNLELKT